MNGNIKILEIDAGEGFKVVGCLTSNELTESLDIVNSQGSANGWVGFRANLQRYAISFEGIQINTDPETGDPTRWSYDSLKIVKRAKTRINWRIARVSAVGYHTGEGYINAINEDASSGDWLIFSGNITGYGEPLVI